MLTTIKILYFICINLRAFIHLDTVYSFIVFICHFFNFGAAQIRSMCLLLAEPFVYAVLCMYIESNVQSKVKYLAINADSDTGLSDIYVQHLILIDMSVWSHKNIQFDKLISK